MVSSPVLCYVEPASHIFDAAPLALRQHKIDDCALPYRRVPAKEKIAFHTGEQFRWLYRRAPGHLQRFNYYYRMTGSISYMTAEI